MTVGSRGIVLGSNPAALQQLQTDINRALAEIRALIAPPQLAKAKLPTDGSIRLAIVTDEVGGEVLAYFTSAKTWKRVTDAAVVS
jgi:hypothetical protein